MKNKSSKDLAINILNRINKIKKQKEQTNKHKKREKKQKGPDENPKRGIRAANLTTVQNLQGATGKDQF